MKPITTVVAVLIALQSFVAWGQEIPCTETFDDNSKYIKFSWANDALKLRGITDRYFTNGNSLEYYYRPTKPKRYERIFFRMPCSPTRNNNFAIAFNMQMYTPKDISIPMIEYGDRPYAGFAYLTAKCISNEFTTSDRITTEYSIGVIGQYSYQKEVQTWYHKLIDSPKPMGWHNQIRNDLALNVKVDYEKGIFRPNKNIEMIGLIESNFGTITNYMGVGSIIRIGSFNDYFINELGLRADTVKVNRYNKNTTRKVYTQNMRRNLQAYFFIKSSARIVIDNSLLQGGIFNRSSPYTLSSDDIKRFYFNAEFGINVTYRGVGLVYSQLFRTAEFKGAFDANWGCVSLIFRLRK